MKSFVYAFFVVAFFSCVLRADVIELKNGQKITGSIRAMEKGKLSVDVEGKLQEYRISAVQSFSIVAEQKVVKEQEPNNNERLSIKQCEAGKHGFLNYTFVVESADEEQFVGSYKVVLEGFVRDELAAIIRRVDASALVSGQFVSLNQRMKCVGTEKLSGGKTVYVFEPFEPEQRVVSKAQNPELDQPHPGGVRVRPLR